MTRWIQATCLAALVALAGAATAEDAAPVMQALLDRFRTDYGFPGATAAIAFHDGRVIVGATGLADREAATAMTPDTPMLAASVGKSFVAAMVLALETDGVLARSDPVSDHLGDRDWFARLPNHDTMTIGDLLHHAAGLPEHMDMEAFGAEMGPRMATGADAPPPEDMIGFVLDAAPLFPAGSGWSYTDTGYLLLGLIIEEATGRSYYEMVTQRLLVPLGLYATTPSNRREIPHLAVGYVAEPNPYGLPARTMDGAGRLLWDPAMEWTGGGLASTSRDLAAWGQALFSGTALDRPYLDRLLDGVAVSPGSADMLYGAGVGIHLGTPRGPVYGHGGWIPGYVTSLRHYADFGVTVAFQINTDVGIVDDSTDVVQALEAALADLAIATAGEEEGRP